jgi:hypothetical protein
VFLQYSYWDGDPNAHLTWHLDSFEGESPLLSPDQTHWGFYFFGHPSYIMQVSAPYWFLSLSFAALTAALGRIWRLGRFTVRTLLLLMTCVAVVAGLVCM